jgi:hypothetical protein
MVSGGIILNSFHLIPFRSAPFHYYFSNPNNGTLLYSIPFRSIPLYFINPNGAEIITFRCNIQWSEQDHNVLVNCFQWFWPILIVGFSMETTKLKDLS